MKPTYSDAGKLAWYPDIVGPVCGGDVNSWDKRCSRALGYRQIVCEGCISEEYGYDASHFPGDGGGEKQRYAGIPPWQERTVSVNDYFCSIHIYLEPLLR